MKAKQVMEFSPERMRDRQFLLEHKIRQTPAAQRTAKRARFAGVTDESALKALSSSWIDGDGEIAGLAFSHDKDVFVYAYEDVSSCMQGKGAFAYDAYTRTGKVAIAVLWDDKEGVVVARALYRMDTGEFFKVYGPDHWRLEGVLIALGLTRSQSWVKDIAPDIYVVRKERGYKTYYRPEKRYPAPGAVRRFVREKELREYVAFASTLYHSVEVYADDLVVVTRGPDLVLSEQEISIPVFSIVHERPYIDGDRGALE